MMVCYKSLCFSEKSGFSCIYTELGKINRFYLEFCYSKC